MTSSSPEAFQTSHSISFSVDFLNEADFISITPNSPFNKETYNHGGHGNELIREREILISKKSDFELIHGHSKLQSADGLLSQGKFLPCTQIQSAAANRLDRISLSKNVTKDDQKRRYKQATSFGNIKLEEPRKWFNTDDEPSPRPPKCTAVWKELLRLRKQRAASSSLSSSSVAKSSSESGRIKPMVNVAVNCNQGKNNSFGALFPLKKRVFERPL